MGGSFSVSMSFDRLRSVPQIFFQASYIQSLEENLTAMRKDMEELKARQIDVLERVQREEDTSTEVKVWLENVDSISNQVSFLLSNRTAELERLSLSGLCSKKIRSNHGYGKRISLMLEKVNDLKSRGDFQVVTEPATKDVSQLSSTIEELKCLKPLEILYVDISSSSDMKQFLSDNQSSHCIEEVCIRDLHGKAYKTLVLPTMKRLRKLNIRSCDIREIGIGRESHDVIMTRTRWTNLSSVVITGCNGLKDLTWLMFVPNLTHLKLHSLEKLEEILSEEKAASSATDEQKVRGLNTPFRKLERIELSNLPMLKSIHWLPLVFPCLKTIDVEMCPKLRKLPLDSESCIGDQEVVINYRDDKWLERIRWQDKATKDRFLLCCVKLMPS